jgi:uncharacterized membrane protein YGL010W
MQRIDRYFADYSSYHRDPRNELTHAIGIPMIVLSVVMLSANLSIGSVDVAWLLIVATSAFYVSLNVPLGLAMAAILVGFHLLGVSVLGAGPLVAVALFVVGWALQFLGHYYEGKRPAFLRNGVHLLVGPLWILDRCLGRMGIMHAHGR